MYLVAIFILMMLQLRQ